MNNGNISLTHKMFCSGVRTAGRGLESKHVREKRIGEERQNQPEPLTFLMS